MRLILFDDFQLGLAKGDRVIPVAKALKDVIKYSPQQLMESVITNFSQFGPRFQEIADKSAGVPLASVRLRAPLPRPTKIICAVTNYREFGQTAEVPMDAFLKSPESVIGHGDTVELPPMREPSVFQHEAEFGGRHRQESHQRQPG